MTIPPTEETRLLDVNAVAKLLSCSARHVYRLADSGRELCFYFDTADEPTDSSPITEIASECRTG